MDTPYTVQVGDFGDPGEYTHVTPTFIEELEGTTMLEKFGPPGKP